MTWNQVEAPQEWRMYVFRNLEVVQLALYFVHFMEPEGFVVLFTRVFL
jgi:hypothetical protein